MRHAVTARETAREAFRIALRSIDPEALVRRFLDGLAPSFVIAVGKAAARMARGAGVAGLVVTKAGHASGVTLPPGIEVLETGHPLPDSRSQLAGETILARIGAAPEDACVVVAVSGGASALAAVPYPFVPSAGTTTRRRGGGRGTGPLTLADKVAVTRALLEAGASIQELNCVRKHLSAIKGGRLACATRARIVAPVLSDVVCPPRAVGIPGGDELDDGAELSVVGGGLVAPDPTTFAEALEIVRRLVPRAPPPVVALLEAGVRGEIADTPKPGDSRFSRVDARILARPRDLGRAAVRALETLGWNAELEPVPVTGPVEALAARLVADAAALAIAVTESGTARARVRFGEPVVRMTAKATGRGGRAQHTALLVARALAGGGDLPHPLGAEIARTLDRANLARVLANVDLAVLCAGSDGTDGPTNDAGGIVDAVTCARAAAAGLDADRALARYDSGSLLARTGDLVTTGPTGTNLGDLYLVLARSRT